MWKWCSIFLLLMACSSTDRARDTRFYQDLNQAYQALKQVDSLSKSSSFARVRYHEAIVKMAPSTQKVLKQYKETPFYNRDSYKAVFHAYESFVLADHLWAQDKGLSLVNARLAEGSEKLAQVQSLIEAEKKDR